MAPRKGSIPWNKGINKVEKVCQFCGKRYITTLGRIKRPGEGKYCSRICRAKSNEVKAAIGRAHKGKIISKEARKKMSIAKIGHRPWNFQNYKSYEPYCPKFNFDFKERVREFWGRKCVLCGIPENGRRHCIHHITEDKKTCCNSAPPLFVPLCGTCHNKTKMKEKQFWFDLFTNLIYLEHDGKCYYTQEEMVALKVGRSVSQP